MLVRRDGARLSRERAGGAAIRMRSSPSVASFGLPPRKLSAPTGTGFPHSFYLACGDVYRGGGRLRAKELRARVLVSKRPMPT